MVSVDEQASGPGKFHYLHVEDKGRRRYCPDVGPQAGVAFWARVSPGHATGAAGCSRNITAMV